MLDKVVQEEPADSLDPVTAGFFASIGIEHGKPFAPDERMKKILTEAAAVGDATARTVAFQSRDKDFFVYPDGHWQVAFVGGYKFQSQPGVNNLDGANFFYFLAMGVTPAMEEKLIGRVRSTCGPPTTRTARRSTAAGPIACTCRRMCRSRTSGR